jgi:hypothetical protein
MIPKKRGKKGGQMRRRAFLRLFLGLAGVGAFPVLAEAPKTEVKILLQNSPLAGFQFHEGKKLWEGIKEGDSLDLIREPDNPYDRNAVRVEWRGHKLGYVPRRENDAVARFMDRGQKLEARVVRLKVSRNPWERIGFEIYLAE